MEQQNSEQQNSEQQQQQQQNSEQQQQQQQQQQNSEQQQQQQNSEQQQQQQNSEQQQQQQQNSEQDALQSFDINIIQTALTTALDNIAASDDPSVVAESAKLARNLKLRLEGVKSGKIASKVQFDPNGEKISLGASNLVDGLQLVYMFTVKQTVNIPVIADLKKKLADAKDSLSAAILSEKYADVPALTAAVQNCQKAIDDSKYGERHALINLLESALREQKDLLAGLQQLDNPKPNNTTNQPKTESSKLVKNTDRLVVASESGDLYLEPSAIPFEGVQLTVDYNNAQYSVKLIHSNTDGWAWYSNTTGKVYGSLRKFCESGEIKNSRGNVPSLARWEPKVKLASDNTPFIKWVISKNS